MRDFVVLGIFAAIFAIVSAASSYGWWLPVPTKQYVAASGPGMHSVRKGGPRSGRIYYFYGGGMHSGK